MREIQFSKMHGAGNDYVYVDAMDGSPLLSVDEIRLLSDRHYGIGGDGIVFLTPATDPACDLRMRMFNADGSEGDMCGNALRCIAKYTLDRGLSSNNPLRVETNDGAKTLECHTGQDGLVDQVRVDMGPPKLHTMEIPLNYGKDQAIDIVLAEIAPQIRYADMLRFTAVSMGNPHAVFFVDKISDELVLDLGPQIERLACFPDRVNVEFVQVESPTQCTMRVWERGSGETLACGTGACAVVVAGVLTNRLSRNTTVKLQGGELEIYWDEAQHSVYKTGPAVQIFDGTCRLLC